MSAERTVLLAVAPNGARLTRADHPRLPMTAAELARTAVEVVEAGAAMIHLHVRDRDGRHALDAALYREAIAAIRAAVGTRLVVQITTEAAKRFDPEAQMAVVDTLRPEATSLALRELCPHASHEAGFAGFLARMKRERVAAQFILYDADDVVRLLALIDRGIVPERHPSVLYVLGRYQRERLLRPDDVLAFLAVAADRLPDFMVCAFGRNEAACGVAAVLLGGDIRVGFENNLHLPNGSLAPDNAALVAAVRRPLAALGYAFKNADDVRKDLALRLE